MCYDNNMKISNDDINNITYLYSVLFSLFVFTFIFLSFTDTIVMLWRLLGHCLLFLKKENKHMYFIYCIQVFMVSVQSFSITTTVHISKVKTITSFDTG